MEEENICRLCLNLAKKEYKLIDAVIRQTLEVILVKVDLNASKNPIVCQDCVEIATKSYHFKSICLNTEELIHSFSTAKGGAQFDIKDIYEDCREAKLSTGEDLNICRFCMNQIGKSCSFSIDFLTNDVYVEMLPLIMPKMVLNVIKDPVICISCMENLESYFEFTKKCFDIEDKINKYRQNEASCSTSQIKLSDILDFLFKNNLMYPEKCTRIPMIKQESEDFEVRVEQIKCEEALDIKDEDIASENSCENLSEIPVDKFEVHVPEEDDKMNLELQETQDKDNIERDGDVLDEKTSKVKTYTCETCSYGTNYKNNLTIHMLIHKNCSEVEMHKCTMCTFETKYKKCLKKHMLIHKSTGVEMHNCTICSYKSKNKKNLTNHMLSHKDASEVEMYKCETCTYETKYKRCLKAHTLVHKDISEIKMHKCTKCSYKTKYKSHLNSHMLIHKDTSEVEMHECEICGYKTRHKNHLKSHMVTHKDASEVQMYKCETCTFETKYKTCIRSHVLIHKDREVYTCEACAYETNCEADMTKHKQTCTFEATKKHKTTSDVLMHKCGICTFETKYKDGLRQHMLTHKDSSEVPMHKCGLCSFQTKHKKNLKIHILKHKNSSEIKMYKCGICTYETRYKQDLKSHTLVHKDTSEVEMHKCGMCTFETKYKRCLKYHMLIHDATVYGNQKVVHID